MTLRRLLPILALLSACATTTPPQHGKVGFGGWTPGGGGSGTVTSVSGTAPIGVATGTTTPVISIGNIPLTAMATQSDQTILGNVSGGAAAPIALTATQTRTMLSVQASSAVAITGGTIGGLTAFNVATNGLYYDATNGFIGILTTSTNLQGNAAGTSGITMVSGGTASSVIELKRLTANGGGGQVGAVYFMNGSTTLGQINVTEKSGASNSGHMDFYTMAAGSLAMRLQLTVTGNIVAGVAAVATNATDGFLYIPTCAGTPTGVPTTQTGTVPLIYDTTNDKFYIYRSGWKGGTSPGAFL